MRSRNSETSANCNSLQHESLVPDKGSSFLFAYWRFVFISNSHSLMSVRQTRFQAKWPAESLSIWFRVEDLFLVQALLCNANWNLVHLRHPTRTQSKPRKTVSKITFSNRLYVLQRTLETSLVIAETCQSHKLCIESHGSISEFRLWRNAFYLNQLAAAEREITPRSRLPK